MSWLNVARIAHDNGTASVLLEEGEEFVLVGAATIHCASGSIDMCGWIVSDEPLVVRGFPQDPPLHGRALASGVEASTSKGCVLVLEAVQGADESPFTQTLRMSPAEMFFNQELGIPGCALLATVRTKPPPREGLPPKTFVRSFLSTPEPWETELASIAADIAATTPSSGGKAIMITGGKNVGKSSFSRLLLNRLLATMARQEDCDEAAVAYLEGDPGQPELGPPGLLSLTVLHDPLVRPGHSIDWKPQRYAPLSHSNLHLSL